jgi:hypothetical protein
LCGGVPSKAVLAKDAIRLLVADLNGVRGGAVFPLPPGPVRMDLVMQRHFRKFPKIYDDVILQVD